jgi:hypothetical protein
VDCKCMVLVSSVSLWSYILSDFSLSSALKLEQQMHFT